jgi:hypothetical protein
MISEPAIERLTRDLQRALDDLRADLDRVEMLTAALSAFSQPVPDYEPAFRHLHQLALTQHQIVRPL